MPSGAKKRKAARRKKEIVDGSHTPSSPTSPHQGVGESHEDHRENSCATNGEEEALVTPMDEQKTDASPVQDDVKETADRDADDKAGVTPAIEDKETVVTVSKAGDSSAPMAVVPAGGPLSSHENEEKPGPVVNNSGSAMTGECNEPCGCGAGESEVPQAPAERRAAWWNCCGLFDLFTRS
ncbi:hypothetical protein Cni_G05993 [Canna indica]|uniref:Uncharacterized protein n=1 Tax=Canna indica TaxID=4628 RepID=A0AAQ3Q5I9_9LILI|nr:hypothetical protein Cni_G05993 [Canna indica]